MKVIALFAYEPPLYVCRYDPDGGDPEMRYPTGAFTATSDITHAKRFNDTDEATGYSQRVSRRTPQRPDGEPNRPLNAFTVGIVEALGGIGRQGRGEPVRRRQDEILAQGQGAGVTVEGDQ